MSKSKLHESEDLIKKYSKLYWSPFLAWVFMWVNAIKDSALFIDGPDCIFYKADMLYKTHDLCSELKQASIDTKLYFSWVMPNKMVRWYDDKIKRKLWFINENPKFNLWVVTCMPVTALLATQYNNIYWDFNKEFMFVPSFTDKFRIDWYSIFLKELAKTVKLDNNTDKKKLNVSIIWYLFDRNEGDCIWNIEEIKRIMSLIWVEINSIWLDWWNYSNLSRVEESELLVSLPYWKYASKILNKRLWTNILELDTPFWLKSTINFIKSIWEKLWINKEIIDLVIFNEFKVIKDKIDILDEKVFLNKKYIYAGDPFLESSIKDIGELLWMDHIITYSYMWNKKADIEDIWSNEIDLIIWNSEFNFPLKKYKEAHPLAKKYKYFEFWFPSYNTHFLINRPYMWFKWLLFFIERLYNELLLKYK